jgi:CDP-diacylglycerol--glycerol-3-phosphate 3-phosphatidyltransferase
MSHEPSPRQFDTLTDRMRFYTGGLVSPLGQRVHKLGIHPDLITAVGLAVVAAASYVISQGHFMWGAIILIVGTPLDALDGAVARAMQRQGKFGALFDSTLDRYSDGFIFMGLTFYYSDQGNELAMLLSMMALLGSLLVSYVRARAEGLDVDCKVGLLTRMERMFIILAMLLTGLVLPGLWLLAVGTHLTVVQRVWYVNRRLAQTD